MPASDRMRSRTGGSSAPGSSGLQAVERGNSLLAFRMDDRKQRIVIDRAMGEGTRFFGWEVADAAALDALAARLETAGVACHGRAADAGRRQARPRPDFVSAIPPAIGWKHFTAPRSTTRRSVPGRSISGFRTGPLGLGHAVLTVENIDPMMAFYVDVLGFGLSATTSKSRFAPISSTSTRGITASR